MSSSRIIYVTGMKPKPPPDEHKRALLRVLVAGLSRLRPAAAKRLSEEHELFALVSWTHFLYQSHRDMGLDTPGIDRLLAQPEPTRDDIHEIDSLARRWSRLWHLCGDSVPALSRFLVRSELRTTLGEVQRYLADTDGVASAIRALLKEALYDAWQLGERVMLLGHSLGSVIAYDSLWEAAHEDKSAGRVDLFVTLGSPLATRFIRKSLRGAHRSGPARYPTNIRRWVNFSAKGEMTALHPRLAPFFRELVDLGLTETLEDHTDLYNHFRADAVLNVHKSYGYLTHAAVAGLIGEWLEAESG